METADPPTERVPDEVLCTLIGAQLETMRTLERGVIDLLLRTIAAFAIVSAGLLFGQTRLRPLGRGAAVVLVGVFTVAVVTWLVDRRNGFRKRKGHLHHYLGLLHARHPVLEHPDTHPSTYDSVLWSLAPWIVGVAGVLTALCALYPEAFV
jgi:asparagine N-glycosylation enzyme membrane subunit Stt3